MYSSIFSSHLTEIGFCSHKKKVILQTADNPWHTHTKNYLNKFHILKIESSYDYRLVCTYKRAISSYNNALQKMIMFKGTHLHLTRATRPHVSSLHLRKYIINT